LPPCSAEDARKPSFCSQGDIHVRSCRKTCPVKLLAMLGKRCTSSLQIDRLITVESISTLLAGLPIFSSHGTCRFSKSRSRAKPVHSAGRYKWQSHFHPSLRLICHRDLCERSTDAAHRAFQHHGVRGCSRNLLRP
jgi:hypothetical protein